MKQKRKTLGQIAYEASSPENERHWGAWHCMPIAAQKMHEDMALAVAKEVLRRARKTDTLTSTLQLRHIK